MPSRIALSDLSEPVRQCVQAIAMHYKVVPVAIDINPGDYNPSVAIVHLRRVYDPFEPWVDHPMPFYIDRFEQYQILEVFHRPIESVTLAAAK